MEKVFLKLFVKDYENVSDKKVRRAYGILSGCVGVFLNILLGVVKIIVGSLTNSISVTADALNNLSDVGSSAVNIIAFKFSGKPADEKHPFGHGRIEYIATIVVAFLVLVMGVELAITSVKKVINPVRLEFSPVMIVILTLTVAAKLWLGLFNRGLGKRINSPALMAIMKDSFSDVAATFATILSLVIWRVWEFNIDGYVGAAVAVFVIWQGVLIAADALNTLLGKPADKEVADSIEKVIKDESDSIIDIHDLILHDYGPGNCFGSAHLEMPASMDFSSVHEIADSLEKKIFDEFSISMVFHLDPIRTDDEQVMELYRVIGGIVNEVDEHFVMHELSVCPLADGKRLVEFDLAIDSDHEHSEDKIIGDITQRITEQFGDSTQVKIHCEHSFVEE